MDGEKYLMYAVAFETGNEFNEFMAPPEGGVWAYEEFTVEVIDVDRGYDDGYRDERSDLKVVLRVTQSDGSYVHFLKTGRQDSYGSYTWNAKLIPVKPISKTVYSYQEV